MAGTAVGVTTFVLGKETDGNREIRVFENGEAYDLDISLVEAYSSGNTNFPWEA